MAKRTDMVTRRVIESRTYDVYNVTKEGLVKVKSGLVIKGRPKTQEVAKELGYEEIVLVPTSTNKKVYGVPIDDFMKIAVEVEQDEE